MKNLVCKALAAGLAIAMMASLAQGAIIGTFGDFTILDTGLTLPVVFVGTGTNPPPVPDPVSITVASTWPGAPDSFTVGQMQTYLSGQGVPSNNFLFCIATAATGSVQFDGIQIVIGGSAVATGVGSMVVPADSHYFLDPSLDLSSYSVSSAIEIGYMVDATDLRHWEHSNMGATPEPVSLAFLGTGFLGMVCARLKRRRR